MVLCFCLGCSSLKLANPQKDFPLLAELRFCLGWFFTKSDYPRSLPLFFQGHKAGLQIMETPLQWVDQPQYGGFRFGCPCQLRKTTPVCKGFDTFRARLGGRFRTELVDFYPQPITVEGRTSSKIRLGAWASQYGSHTFHFPV